MTFTETKIPKALEAEQAVLGAILLDDRALDSVAGYLDADSFYAPVHRKIFKAMLELYTHTKPVDLITVAEFLETRLELENIGGRSYLGDLAGAVATSANVTHYAEIIKDRANLRRLVSLAGELEQKSRDSSNEPKDIIDQLETEVFKIAQSQKRQQASSLKSILAEGLETIDRYHKGERIMTGVATGFEALDEMTFGLQPADLVVIAGRPSMGKTSLACTIALHVAIYEKKAVGVFSIETSKEQMALRFLCAQAMVNSWAIRSGKLRDEDWARISLNLQALADAPIYIDDSSTMTVLDIRAQARRLKHQHGIEIIIVDYLQLIRGSKWSESRQQEITQISQGLKALAKDLHIPVIALSQLSRKTEDRPGKRPELSDLRESGAIEQDADLVMMVYRPEFYGLEKFPDHSPAEGLAEIRILKHRNGPTGDRKLVFLKQYAKFENLSQTEGE